MSRVTYGITCPPFLASSVLQQVAEDHAHEYPWASDVVKGSFYVDDCFAGAVAASLQEELNACMRLRKWSSSSPQLKETDQSTLADTPSDSRCSLEYPVGYTPCTASLTSRLLRTKREVASAVFALSTIQIKILLQKLWR